MTVSSANCAILVLLLVGKSAIYMLNRAGDKGEPWGTPAAIGRGLDEWLSTLTVKVLLVKKLLTT